jgi:DNA-binding transcriptional ArsR family regulator
MSRKRRSTIAGKRRDQASVFAALGDATRLALVAKLAGGQRHSIAQLTRGSKLTRQAISKHLRVLEMAGMVQGARSGRENLFELSPQPIAGIRQYLEFVCEQWDQALSRLKTFVET